jgi:hypothetical protein
LQCFYLFRIEPHHKFLLRHAAQTTFTAGLRSNRTRKRHRAGIAPARRMTKQVVLLAATIPRPVYFLKRSRFICCRASMLFMTRQRGSAYPLPQGQNQELYVGRRRFTQRIELLAFRCTSGPSPPS